MGLEKMSDREPLITCRNTIICCQNQEGPHFLGQVYGVSGDCIGGNRHEGGMISKQAFIWNTGTCRDHDKGTLRMVKTMRANTDGLHRGGAFRSRVERSVMDLDRRESIIQLPSSRQLMQIRKISK